MTNWNTASEFYQDDLREPPVRPSVGHGSRAPWDASQRSASSIPRQPASAVVMPKTHSKNTPQLQGQAGLLQGRNKPLPSTDAQLHGTRHTTVQLHTKEGGSKPASARLERRPSVSERTHQNSSSTQYLRDHERSRDTTSSSPRIHKPVHRHRSSSLSTRGYSRDEYDMSQTHRKYGRLETEQARPSSRATASPQTAASDVHERYEALIISLEGKLQAQISRMEEKERRISTLESHINKLNQDHSEQLSSMRRELGSCQSQLDNVQRFVSTADIHAEQDVIQKLLELNEVVYQTSMMMADHVADSYRRGSMSRRVTRAQSAVSAKKIDPTIANYVATVEDKDIALSLQIVFQGYLVNLLCRIVSSWTENQEFNTLLEGTYQRLRRAETQAISGRWRSLTRAHLQSTPIRDPKVLVQQTIHGLFGIVMVAGFITHETQVKERLWEKFGEKISTIASQTGKFGNMVADMVSGDFELFVVQPGETFDEERMVDMNEDPGEPRKKGTSQTVLCVTRAGLTKRVGHEKMTLSKAEVVLKSFLD